MIKLVEFYKNWLEFNDYYDLQLSQKLSQSNEFIKHSSYLHGIEISKKVISDVGKNFITTQIGDVRLDVPVWFGDIEKSKIRIVILGLEPRDTDSIFNIEKIGNKVFGTPFGINRWNLKSTVKYKPQNKYLAVFEKLFDRNDVFLLFSDAVKTYQVKVDKKESDDYARKIFKSEFERQKEMLFKELSLINPTHILTLGNDTYNKVNSSAISEKYDVFKIRHPAQGGKNIAKKQIEEMFLP